MKDKIIITTGDPNGIGAEITLKALNKIDLPVSDVVIVSNSEIINFYGKLNKNYEIIEVPYKKSDILPGKVTAQAGEFSYMSLKKACELKGRAIVTAPVAKKALHLAGHNFNGQTEILQEYLSYDGQLAEMLFVSGNFRVLLLTRHCALKEVVLTKELVVEKVTTLYRFFTEKLRISEPKFALCGFNPHSGEDGILGREEIEILQPAVEFLRQRGINISKPLPADTLFAKYFDYDCIIANYHDQGLIPIKTLAGLKTVNMTIGLDVIRTSPGHGTAFDIAGKNIADETGMVQAMNTVRFL